VGSEVVAEPRSVRAEASRRTKGREMSSEEMLIAYEELEREMNELRNSIGKKTNPSDSEALSAWKERVEISRTEAYNNLEVRTVKLADVAERAQGRRYGGARIIEVAPIRESTANATVNGTADATDASEGRSTSVACKERGEGIETMDKSCGKAKSIKKEELARVKGSNQRGGKKRRRAEKTLKQDRKKRRRLKKNYVNPRLRPSLVKKRKTHRRDERIITKIRKKKRGVKIGVVILKKKRRVIRRPRKRNRARIRVKQRNAVS